MTVGTPVKSPEASAWSDQAERLTDWSMQYLVNRADTYGGYRQTSDRAKGKQYTAKDGLSRSRLVRHYRGIDGCIAGLHTTSPENTSRWFMIDVDAHGEEGQDPELNWQFVLLLYVVLVQLGFKPLLFDSNGRGGFHLWVVFDEPVVTEHVRKFGLWLVREWQKAGLKKQPEVFPKQFSIAPGGFGNWARLPGRHHTNLGHWSKLWDGAQWLSGQDAIEAILETEGDPPRLIPTEALNLPLAEAPRSASQAKERSEEELQREIELAAEAVHFLPPEFRDDYDKWFSVGCMLRELEAPGLRIWADWSRLSPKYRPGDCEAKWGTISVGQGPHDLKLGSLYMLAKEHDWKGLDPKPRMGATGNSKMPHADITPPDPGPDPDSEEPEWPRLRLGEMPSVELFPDYVFPDPVSDYIRAAADSIGCPCDFIALPVLIAADAAIGRSVSLQRRDGVFRQLVADPPAAVLEALLATGAVNEDAAHRLGGRGEEVPAAVPGRSRFGADQAEVRLVDQRGGLESLAGLFPGQPLGRQRAQLVVDQGQQLLGSMSLALLNLVENSRCVSHGE